MVHTELDRKLEPVTGTLNDGTEILIREARIQDAADLIRCVRTYLADSESQVMQPDEYNPDLAQGREFIQSYIESGNSLLLVAFHGERLIGNLDITGGKRIRLRHTGLLGMGMAREYRSKGLGTRLLSIGIAWARSNHQLEKLWLQILDGNTNAISLYRKMGFAEEGRQKGFVKVADDKYLDNIIMHLPLNK